MTAQKLSSMTGFSRLEGRSGAWQWAWELKAVNGKGLDVKVRVPPVAEPSEPSLRGRVAARLQRGSVLATLTMRRDAGTARVRINEALVDQMVDIGARIAARTGGAPLSVDGILAIRGVLDTVDDDDTVEEREQVMSAVASGLEVALDALVEMRIDEGAALARVLEGRLAVIETLTMQADAHPSRQPAALRAKLATAVDALLETGRALDAERLHQEAILLAAKADIREELDRLHAHVAQARHMLRNGGPVGRKLDFLAQEFNREANTLCSKANDVALTSIGLELKTVVEQFREQVQNLE